MAIRIEIIPGSNGNPPTVDQPTVSVSKGNGDRVHWWSQSHDWAVVFDGDTPFEHHYFSPCNPGNKEITAGEGSYKYTIFIDGNCADPMIIVKR
ncbi:MAG TPA: hypothetical protein VFJ52_12585 [Terriglobia bacterium]|nr:hypothetical protein [Terriglobia bacterium]